MYLRAAANLLPSRVDAECPPAIPTADPQSPGRGSPCSAPAGTPPPQTGCRSCPGARTPGPRIPPAAPAPAPRLRQQRDRTGFAPAGTRISGTARRQVGGLFVSRRAGHSFNCKKPQEVLGSQESHARNCHEETCYNVDPSWQGAGFRVHTPSPPAVPITPAIAVRIHTSGWMNSTAAQVPASSSPSVTAAERSTRARQ